nr:unnamed protein product [Digitaria exilis]
MHESRLRRGHVDDFERPADGAAAATLAVADEEYELAQLGTIPGEGLDAAGRRAAHAQIHREVRARMPLVVVVHTDEDETVVCRDGDGDARFLLVPEATGGD